MYLREVGEFLQLKSICEATMLAFESVYFGKHSIGRDAFLELWNQLELFHQCLIVPAANVPPNSDHPVVAIPS